MSQAVQDMFGQIAHRYDLVNRLLSARRDVAWRRVALNFLPDPPGTVLDLATGTGDLGAEALAYGKAKKVHGADFCVPMLQAGSERRAQSGPFSATAGDALNLPYADNSFDAAMVAYGWRNFDDLARLAQRAQTGAQTRWHPDHPRVFPPAKPVDALLPPHVFRFRPGHGGALCWQSQSLRLPS